MRSYLTFLLLISTASAHSPGQNALDFKVAPNGIPTCIQVDSSGRMHIVWNRDSSCYSVFDKQGQPLGRPLNFAAHASQSPSLALSSNKSALVWRQLSVFFNSYIYGRVYSQQDSTLSQSVEFQDSYGDAERFAPRVAHTNDSTLVVVWSGTGRQTQQGSGIYGQFSTSSMQLLGSNLLLSDDTLETRQNTTARIATIRDGDRIGVVWLRGNSWDNTLVARWFTDSGLPLASSIIVPTDTTRKYYWGHSIARMPDSGYLVAWSAVGSDSVCNVFMRRFNADGMPTGSEIQVNVFPAISFSEAEVAVDANGASIVAWESEGQWVRVKAQRFDQHIGKIGSEFSLSPTQDTLNQYWPVVQLFDNKIYASWRNGSEVRGSIMDFANPPVSVSLLQQATSYELGIRTYPNPFNASTVVQFSLPSGGRASLTVYDLLGREVLVLANGYFESGTHSLKWQAQDLPSGIYLLRLNSHFGSTIRKTIIVR